MTSKKFLALLDNPGRAGPGQSQAKSRMTFSRPWPEKGSEKACQGVWGRADKASDYCATSL